MLKTIFFITVCCIFLCTLIGITLAKNYLVLARPDISYFTNALWFFMCFGLGMAVYSAYDTYIFTKKD